MGSHFKDGLLDFIDQFRLLLRQKSPSLPYLPGDEHTGGGEGDHPDLDELQQVDRLNLGINFLEERTAHLGRLKS